MIKFKICLNLAFAALIVFATSLSSCEKTEILAEKQKSKTIAVLPPDDLSNYQLLQLEPSIQELKSFMATSININSNEIAYDPEIQEFIVFGRKQITLEELKVAYSQSSLSGIQ